MSKSVTLDEIKKFWPEKAPNINIVQKYVSKYEKERIVIKYGGNVLIDRNVFNNFISDINVLNKLGLSIIVVTTRWTLELRSTSRCIRSHRIHAQTV